MKSISIHEYTVDPQGGAVFCDQKPIACVESASQISSISNKTFGVFQWVYFYALDLLSHVSHHFKEKQIAQTRKLCHVVEALQQRYLKRQEAIDSFVRDHFELVSSNVEHINDAEVLCLGEQHNSFGYLFRNAQLIDALSEPDDLLLLEYDGSLSIPWLEQIAYLRKNLPLIGWDKRDDTNNEIFQVRPCMATDVINHRFLGERAIDRGGEIGNLEMQKISNDMLSRNIHMCERIESNVRQNRRIYVMAGMDHFKKCPLVDGWDQTKEYEAIDRTLTFLKTKKYAILIPKEDFLYRVGSAEEKKVTAAFKVAKTVGGALKRLTHLIK